ncbi:MAG: dihydrolipoyl dehydrogenase [Spirochaetia bacterium]
MSKYDYDITVIGSGPGGYVAAIRAGQLGLKTAVIEKDSPGGVCLNIGCIPSKALIHQAEIFSSISELKEAGVTADVSGFDYSKVFKKSRAAASRLSKGVKYLLKKNSAELVMGEGIIKDPHTVIVDGKDEIKSGSIIIATGSRPRELPPFPFDGEKILSSSDALMLEKLPESIIILGAGAIGMEFAHIMNTFGTKVTVVELLDQILPLEDAEVSEVLDKDFRKRGIEIHTGTTAKKVEKTDRGIKLSVETGEGKKEFEAEKLLVAVGRAPNSEGIGLENINVKTEKGFIMTGDYYQTDEKGVYAIGDVIPTPLLAHVASREGEIAVEHIAGKAPREKRVDPWDIPSAVYTEPQIASFGLKEEDAEKEGRKFKKSVFPFRGAGKAVAIGKPEGMVKLLTDSETGEILGAHIAGSGATELIHELLLAKTAELLPEDIYETIHAHPTLSEAVMEAAREAGGGAVHI